MITFTKMAIALQKLYQMKLLDTSIQGIIIKFFCDENFLSYCRKYIIWHTICQSFLDKIAKYGDITIKFASNEGLGQQMPMITTTCVKIEYM